MESIVKVNFIDLKGQYLSIKEEIDKIISQVINSTQYVSGVFVESFEQQFAKIHEVKYCVCVNSGTSALHVSLMALNIGAGDEVIVPTYTFFATPEAVSLVGATPVFIDCDPTYFNMEPPKIEKAITDKTKAIIPVHLFGQPVQLDEIQQIAEKYNLYLIEDCSQAHLSKYHDKYVGTHGILGCFSFYPSKNLGAYGEGGAVITDDENMYNQIKALRQHGLIKKNSHGYIGHNYRMDEIQGAILNVKLKYLPAWTEKRRINANEYRNCLRNIKQVTLPDEMPNTKHVYHLFTLRVSKRDELAEYLAANGISTQVYYPIPCHLQPAYSFLGYTKGHFPNAEQLAKETISLPMFPELSPNEIAFIAKKIKAFYTDF
jgi:dTDP-4-amino-4,6-dideoxygalactose transaminase